MRCRPRFTIREMVLLVVIVALAAGWAVERRRVLALLEAMIGREEINLVPILDPIEGESDK